MKKGLMIIAVFASVSLSAQSVVQGTISTSGKTITSSDGAVQVNFTLGQPFGEGEMTDSEISIVQGLQGAGANITDVSDDASGSLGIDNYADLDATLLFNEETGSLVLRGSNLQTISGKVMLCDLNGKVLSSAHIHEGIIEDEIRVDTKTKGMYLITILTDDQKRLSKKIIF